MLVGKPLPLLLDPLSDRRHRTSRTGPASSLMIILTFVQNIYSLSYIC